ncbi:ABC transporter substrate-binding protein [Streptomyces tubercidicus]|uniref:ABC transporter substrate-binding protein n=1 Tax=Streptomyces tubercidicus TaxID=47759 RepID=UPI0036A4697C
MSLNRTLIRVLGAFGLAVVTAVVPAAQAEASNAQAEASKATASIKVGYQPNMGSAAILSIGIDKGMFDKEHLKVEPVQFPSGQALVDALSSGQIDIGYVGPGAAFHAMQGAAKVLTWDNIALGDAVLARKGSGITTPGDLVGKKVLVPEGTSADMVLRVALKEAGVDYKKVTTLASTPDAATAAFAAGQADAIAIWAPFTNQLEAAGKLVHVASDNPADPVHISKPKMVGLWLANNDFFSERQSAAAAFLRADAAANDYRKDHAEAIVPAVSKFAGVPAKLLKASIPTYKFMTSDEIRSGVTDGTLAGYLKGLNRVMVSMGQLKSVVPVDNYFPQRQIAKLYQSESGSSVAATKDSGVSAGVVVAVVAGLIVLLGGGLLLKRRMS